MKTKLYNVIKWVTCQINDNDFYVYRSVLCEQKRREQNYFNFTAAFLIHGFLCFSIGLKLPIVGQNLRFWGVNKQMLK